MTRSQIDAFCTYVEAAIELALADREIGSDGYSSSCAEERKAKEAAIKALYEVLID